MNYEFKLKTIGIFFGLLLIAGHAYALAKPAETRGLLARLPRSFPAGVAILAVDLLWTLWLMFRMDWGEFYYLRTPLFIAVPVFFFLTLRYVDEFLAARALGILGLLVAAPMLDAAFLQPPVSRLLVVILAYAYIVLGMFWVGIPHLLRDQLEWVSRSAERWKLAMGVGVAYGALLLLCALVWY